MIADGNSKNHFVVVEKEALQCWRQAQVTTPPHLPLALTQERTGLWQNPGAA